jgi:hypothetical protein
MDAPLRRNTGQYGVTSWLVILVHGCSTLMCYQEGNHGKQLASLAAETNSKMTLRC